MSCQSILLAASLCAWSFCVLVSMVSYRDDFFLVVHIDDVDWGAEHAVGCFREGDGDGESLITLA